MIRQGPAALTQSAAISDLYHNALQTVLAAPVTCKSQGQDPSKYGIYMMLDTHGCHAGGVDGPHGLAGCPGSTACGR